MIMAINNITIKFLTYIYFHNTFVFFKPSTWLGLLSKLPFQVGLNKVNTIPALISEKILEPIYLIKAQRKGL